MVKSIFIDNTPLIKIAVGWEQVIRTPLVVLDTGFTGDLVLTSKLANELGLQVIGVTPAQIANGETIETPVALALVSMEGFVNQIEVLISESIPVIGISFLSKFGYKAIVDCKNKKIELERVDAQI